MEAFSEPETAAIRDFLLAPEQLPAPSGKRFAFSFSIALNFHTYGRYVNVPYSCMKRNDTGAMATYYEIAQRMTAENKWRWGHSWQHVRVGCCSCPHMLPSGFGATTFAVGNRDAFVSAVWPVPREWRGK